MPSASNKPSRSNFRLPLTLLVLAAFVASTSTFFAERSAAADVVWANGVNVTISGNSVEKTGGVNYTFDAGAESQELIQDNGGADWYVEFTVPQVGSYYFHVSCESMTSSSAELLMQFGYNGGLTIYDPAGNYTGTHAANDVFRIARVSGAIKFSKNGAVIHTASLPPVYYPLHFRFGARESNSKIANAVVVNDAHLPLGAPRNLSASVASATQINLSWADRATAETGFKIERRAGESGAWAQIGTAAANATSYSDTDSSLARNVPYSYRVRAHDAAGDGGYSANVHATVPPATLGSVKTDTNVYAEGTTPTKPLSSAYVYDPVFGARLMRVTDTFDGSSHGGTAYSYWPTFNSDGTRLLAQLVQPQNSTTPTAALYDFDPVNFKLGARRYPHPLPGGGQPSYQWAIWSNTDPDLFYAADLQGRLWSYDVADQAWSLIADFDTTGVTNPIPSGHYGWQMQMSEDDDVFSFTESSTSPQAQVGYFVYRKSTDTIVKRVADTNVDEVHIDKTGRYLFGVTNTHSQTDGDGAIEGFVWDLQAGTPRENLTDSSPDMSPGHHDVGRGIIVGNANWGAGTMNKRSFASPHSFTTVLGPVAPATYGQPMDHHSMLADNEEWVFGSNFGDNQITRECGKELFQVKLDGTGSLRRLAHHYALWDDSLCNEAGGWDCDYENTPRANISKDGRLAAFTSNWNSLRGRRDLYVAKFDPAPASNSGPQAVVWTDPDKVTTGAGGAIHKTQGSASWPPASANSTQSITGDGYFEAKVNNNGSPSTYVMNVGLNSGDLTTAYEYYWAVASGYAQPYVNNTYQASTAVTTSDTLRIAVESGVVKFYKNAELVYTSTVAPSFPLKARFDTVHDNAGLTTATISADAPPASADASWTDLVKSTTGASGSIVKTTGSGDWPPASAATVQSLSGDGTFECVVNNNGSPNLYVINVGLNSGDLSALEYYWAIASGYAQPYVNGTYQASTTVTTNDHLKIVVESGVVKFYKNAELVYTSTVAPSYPLKGYFMSGFDGVGLSSASFVGSN